MNEFESGSGYFLMKLSHVIENYLSRDWIGTIISCPPVWNLHPDQEDESYCRDLLKSFRRQIKLVRMNEGIDWGWCGTGRLQAYEDAMVCEEFYFRIREEFQLKGSMDKVVVGFQKYIAKTFG